MSSDVIHRWEPSERLTRLIARHEALVDQADDQVSAHQWICDNAARFPSKQKATAIANLVARHFGRKLTLAELRKKVARSRIDGQLVKGDLQGLSNLGVGKLAELRRVLEVSL